MRLVVSSPATTRDSEKTLVVLQPGYLPWLGFFDQMRRSDIFVYYDDVQFDKHGWRNRNRIKGPSGPQWLTVPVHHKGWPRIMDVTIDNRMPWARKHVGTIRQGYARAAYVDRYLPELEALLERGWEQLVDLDLAVVDLMCGWLGLQRTITRASELGVQGDKSERLLNLCLHFGARRYLSGNSAQSYLDIELFARHGIAVEWQNYDHPIYGQLHGDFVRQLSTLDLVLNCGPESAAILHIQELGAAR